MSAASRNLHANQRQLDMDGCEVGVSRQAVDETLTEYDNMVAALAALLHLHGKPHREAWLSDYAWENALLVTDRAKTALDRAIAS